MKCMKCDKDFALGERIWGCGSCIIGKTGFMKNDNDELKVFCVDCFHTFSPTKGKPWRNKTLTV